jgi:hypothetical protein
MKTLAAIIVLTLCAPAIADPAPPAAPVRLQVAVSDAKAAEVAVTRESPCAEVNENRPERNVKMTACLRGDDLVIDWETRVRAAGHKSRSTLRVAQGARAELGGDQQPHLVVTVL